MMRETLVEIARAGILAPSADNRHVFRLEMVEAGLRLWPTAEFASTTERHRQLLGWMSLGAVVENMRLTAGELGLVTTVRWFELSAVAPMAEVDIRQAEGTVADTLAAAISTRHTNRRMYRGPAMTEAERASLGAEATSVESVHLTWLDGKTRRRALGLIWRAESERFLRQRLHEELFSSIRFDLSWQVTADVALPPGALEVEAPMRPLFKALRHWRLMRPFTWLGGHWMLGLRAGWLPAWQAPDLGVLTVNAPVGEHSARMVGIAFERLWLRSELLGLALQPMAASAILQYQTDEDQGASAELRRNLNRGWTALGEGAALMVFRIGRAPKPAVTSGRPPVESFWTETG